MKRIVYLMVLCLAISSCHVDESKNQDKGFAGWDNTEVIKIDSIESIPLAVKSLQKDNHTWSDLPNHIRVLDYDKAYVFNSAREFNVALADNLSFKDSLINHHFDFTTNSLVVICGVASGPVDKIDYQLSKAASSENYRLDIKLHINDSMRYMIDWELQLKVPKINTQEVDAFVQTTRPITNQRPTHRPRGLNTPSLIESTHELVANSYVIIYRESDGPQIFDMVNWDDSCTMYLYKTIFNKGNTGKTEYYSWDMPYVLDKKYFGKTYGDDLCQSMLLSCSENLIQQMKDKGLLIYTGEIYRNKHPFVISYDSAYKFYPILKFVYCVNDYKNTINTSYDKLMEIVYRFTDEDVVYRDNYISVDCNRFHPLDVQHFLNQYSYTQCSDLYDYGYYTHSPEFHVEKVDYKYTSARLIEY